MNDVRLYDFKKSEKFSIENIRHLIMMSEEFCKTSNLQISYETKKEGFKLELETSNQVSYDDFLERTNKDDIIIEYNIDSNVQNLTLFIDKSVVLSLVDLLLGGSGKVKDINREPTKIDLELTRYLIQGLLQRIYLPYKYNSVEITGIYTNTAQYQRLTGKDIVFESIIGVKINNCNIGRMRFCMPYKSMEPVINNLVNIKVNSEEEEKLNDIFSNEIFEYVKNVDMDIQANLGTIEISINDLLNIKEGDVILLNQQIHDDIIVKVGGADIYKAKPGTLGIKKGVQITDIISRER
ncbi:FliM/FliN family flagellar motor switch protein [Clostridium sardiniense]|uniref:Flagellar motor switch protein FliM n=1 Tax=Clostridium sardiniense TaxID=29369 RepID=A0ABS7KV05_CLOSR|nr:FliM/FliN family flagellar motor switch protein [Clostridium sardiniense]MBY0754644.1 FliM/FliN family flagellar motor switch protein [Clostridium sardiniense]MDQ0460636.1 flagellar motor switch protein FliM [Clostridium sardiniense]